jgi:hypothetical protein
MIDILEKYTKIAKLYQTDDLYDGYQPVIISAEDLLAIIERLELTERTLALLVAERFQSLPVPEQDTRESMAEAVRRRKALK